MQKQLLHQRQERQSPRQAGPTIVAVLANCTTRPVLAGRDGQIRPPFSSRMTTFASLPSRGTNSRHWNNRLS